MKKPRTPVCCAAFSFQGVPSISDAIHYRVRRLELVPCPLPTTKTCFPREERCNSSAGAPEIAFKVMITDSISVFQRKVSSYLRNGAPAVWCVYPTSGFRHLHRPRMARIIRGGSAGIAVSAIFESV
jgi:hypothetical protein